MREDSEPIERHNMSLITHDIGGTAPNKFKKFTRYHNEVGQLYQHINLNARSNKTLQMDSLDELRASQLNPHINDRNRVDRQIPLANPVEDNIQANMRNYDRPDPTLPAYMHPSKYQDPFQVETRKPEDFPMRSQEPLQRNQPSMKRDNSDFDYKTMENMLDPHRQEVQYASGGYQNKPMFDARPTKPAADPREEYIANLYKRYASPPMDYRALHPPYLKFPAVSAKYLHSEYQENFLPGEVQSQLQNQLPATQQQPPSLPESRVNSAIRVQSGYKIAHSEYELNRKHTRAAKNPVQMIFDAESLIPERFKNDPRYHIVRAEDGRFHVYDMTRWNHKIIFDHGRVGQDNANLKRYLPGDKLFSLNEDYNNFVGRHR